MAAHKVSINARRALSALPSAVFRQSLRSERFCESVRADDAPKMMSDPSDPPTALWPLVGPHTNTPEPPSPPPTSEAFPRSGQLAEHNVDPDFPLSSRPIHTNCACHLESEQPKNLLRRVPRIQLHGLIALSTGPATSRTA